MEIEWTPVAFFNPADYAATSSFLVCVQEGSERWPSLASIRNGRLRTVLSMRPTTSITAFAHVENLYTDISLKLDDTFVPIDNVAKDGTMYLLLSDSGVMNRPIQIAVGYWSKNKKAFVDIQGDRWTDSYPAPTHYAQFGAKE